MQNGGFLLWDVPSQYGFLSMIFLYLVPVQSAWIKIYILNSTLTLIISLILFKIIWNNRNFAWYLIALLLTWSMLFVVSAGPRFENYAKGEDEEKNSVAGEEKIGGGGGGKRRRKRRK